MIRLNFLHIARICVWLGGCFLLAVTPGFALDAPPPAVLAGTYRIDSWKNLEGRGLYHFFYLDPGGRFYLAGEWKGSESSRFGGIWRMSGDQVQLTGVADVNTNQGRWTIPFHRTFRIDHSQGAVRLTPAPEKNRFGLMGWPNTFVRAELGPAVNIPGGVVPEDAKQIVSLSEVLAPLAR